MKGDLAPEYAEACRQIALLIASLEKAQQARDAVLRQVHPAARTQPGSQWRLLGRLHERGMRASEAYRFWEMALQQKWITKREFDEALADAIEASGELK